MKNPTKIVKKSSKHKETTTFTVSYNGKELGKIGIYNVFTTAGIQGLRIKWYGHNEPVKLDDYILDFTDKDEMKNIRHTK